MFISEGDNGNELGPESVSRCIDKHSGEFWLMIDLKNFETSEILKNGVDVTIRAVRPSDKDLFIEIFNNLNPETIYNRFFHRKTSLSDTDLQRLTELDFSHRVGLITTIPGPKGETLIGVGRYTVLPPLLEGQRRAEVAFTVEEDFQGQGLAGRLLHHLIGIAREQGIKTLEAEVLADNVAMLRVFSRCQLDLQTTYLDGEILVAMAL